MSKYPNPDDFDTYEHYILVLIDHTVEKKTNQRNANLIKSIIISACIVSASLFYCFYIYLEQNRFEISSGYGYSYKLDRKTGKVTALVQNKELYIVNQ
jgi:hypothetical protein